MYIVEYKDDGESMSDSYDDPAKSVDNKIKGFIIYNIDTDKYIS